MASDDPTPQDPARSRQGGPAVPPPDAPAPESTTPAGDPAAAADDAFVEPAPTQAEAADAAHDPAAKGDAPDADAPHSDASRSDPHGPAAAAAPDAAPDRDPIDSLPVRATRPSPWGAVLSGALAGAVVAVAAAWALTQYAPPPGQNAAMARMDALEARLAAERTTKAQRISQLETALKQINAVDLQPITAAITQLRAGDSRTEADLSALRTQQQALQTAVQGGGDSAKAQIADLGRKIDAAQARIEAVSTQAQAMDRASAAVTVMALLRDAVLSGRPFAMELDAARAVLGPSAGSLDPFGAAATQGYASPAKLATRLAEQGAAALAAQPNAPRADSLVNRLISSAEGLVRVTPPEGGGANAPESAAQLQTAVAAVRAGDLDAALAALQTLPAPVKDKLQPVMAEIEGRRTAATAATTLFQQALAAISGKVP